MDTSSASDIVLIHGNSHPDLANKVAERMGIKSGGCSVFHKTNRETMVEIGDSVRGKDIYIIQTGTKDANNNIMELLIMAYACRTSSARSIVGVIPYLPYSKQCKMRKRGCIVSKLLAKVSTCFTKKKSVGYSFVVRWWEVQGSAKFLEQPI
uniref:Phosphoribosyl pyrophosphate synthase-associated protein 2 n=1 Tax=Bactrocera latifrons TaxID=174628 RepID=A0A0K8UM96_BACLA